MNNFNFPTVKLVYEFPMPYNERICITGDEISFEILKESFGNSIEHHEEMHILLLDNANNLKGIYVVSCGGICFTQFDLRLILQAALLSNSTSIVVAHNHPTGNLTPSEADKRMAKRINEACKLIDILVHSFLIISKEKLYNMNADLLII